LIHGAIEQALDKIAEDLELSESERPEIDHDTKGAKGAVDIAKEILEKIENSTAFIADITPVGSTPKGKKIPNPNVMIELGFAMKSPGYQSVIPVLNTGLGAKPEDLPFDLRNRRCVTYECKTGASDEKIKKVQKKLASDLAAALQNNLPEPKAAGPVDFEVLKASASPDGAIWAGGDDEMEFTGAFVGELNQIHPMAHGPKSYIRMLPSGWKDGSLSLTSYRDLGSDEKPPVPTSLGSSGSWGATSDGFQHFFFWGRKDPPRELSSITKYFEGTGEIWSCRVGVVEHKKLAYQPVIKHWASVLSAGMTFFDKHGAEPERYVEVGLLGTDGLRAPGNLSLDSFPYRKASVKLSRVSSDWTKQEQDQFLLDALNEIASNLMIGPLQENHLNKILRT
ncbi:MAG: hypothetical protein AAFZ74_19130, partial [Pseudomonadota bacterium]